MQHGELDYTRLEPMFTCVLTATNMALGMAALLCVQIPIIIIIIIINCSPCSKYSVGFRFATEENENSFCSHLDTIIQSTDLFSIYYSLHLHFKNKFVPQTIGFGEGEAIEKNEPQQQGNSSEEPFLYCLNRVTNQKVLIKQL